MKSDRILVVRNDKLGDFMLAWPALALIKQRHPEWHITALVPGYTAPMAELCPWIDELLIDGGEKGSVLAKKFRAGKFDALLTLFSTSRVAWAGWLARIPYRLAPATKLAQLLYNQRLRQRRSRSEKPEYAYNIDLALRLIADLDGGEYRPTIEVNGDYLPAEIDRPLLKVATTQDEAGLANEGRLIIIHPGSGGSANTLRPEQYAELARGIECSDCRFIITAGPGEEENAQQVVDGIGDKARLVTPGGGLPGLVQLLAQAALFISASTGPLHIAAALDRPTAAFYPRRRSATPLRWQTTNAARHRLAFTPPETAEAEDVQACDITAAAAAISRLLEG